MNPLSAKKSLGQHWLFDQATLKKIVAAGEITKKDTVLEIGPGRGSLTKLLLKQAKIVIAVEKDRQLAARLTRSDLVQDRILHKKLEVVGGDILQFDLGRLPKGYKVVANIPYYLTSKLLRRLLEDINPPSVMALLVQKEVAERIVARPGQMSVLAVSVQYYGTAEIVGMVPKELFKPAPKVDSAIIKIKRRVALPHSPADSKKFFRLVKAGFGERRKQLKNSLAGGLRLSLDQAVNNLRSAGINPAVRAQELSLADWRNLYQQIAETID
ncbi:ribosomal RNA small subunit methyltransferase A [Candidatus Microgenomates bacterium]|nr:ribosomal RNA small subunit methyltransferase A [Candidatus Microgenomates bacterium]